jgi:hypothetical protein
MRFVTILRTTAIISTKSYKKLHFTMDYGVSLYLDMNWRHTYNLMHPQTSEDKDDYVVYIRCLYTALYFELILLTLRAGLAGLKT